MIPDINIRIFLVRNVLHGLIMFPYLLFRAVPSWRQGLHWQFMGQKKSDTQWHYRLYCIQLLIHQVLFSLYTNLRRIHPVLNSPTLQFFLHIPLHIIQFGQRAKIKRGKIFVLYSSCFKITHWRKSIKIYYLKYNIKVQIFMEAYGNTSLAVEFVLKPIWVDWGC